MLMFSKISLESFAYDFTQTFFFPNKKRREIYGKYMIEQVFFYSILRDIASICVFFIFICKPESDLPNSKFREVIVENEIFHRFDTSQKLWENYSARNKSLKKKLGYFSIENIDDPCMVTVALNPKEYFEGFKSENINKKHKGLKKGVPSMEFEDYAKRINFIREMKHLAN